ncbi:MAG: MBOAT family protein [Acidimicrobiales bacterium]|nr:MBOAT family protein [Acidimicrobiales bacterium]
MLFPTAQFGIFFIIVFLVSWRLRPNRRAWMAFTLAASYVFYGWWDWRFVLLIAGSTLFNQAMGTAIHRNHDDGTRKLLMGLAVSGNLVVLGFFKYYEFFVVSVTNGLAKLGLDANPPLLRLILPIGISFFTFQAISYVVDIYRRELEPASPIEFGMYLSFFPHLVAGPIVRASEFVPQLRRRPDEHRIPATEAFFLIVAGLFKKVVIASWLGTEVVDPVFAVPGNFSSLEILFAVYGYAMQIYADFSGYTDIAIGIALLLGIRFPQNFDRPYSALSIQDFWRRWHITLSRWLRDYLYIPLGGSRGSESATYRNLMLTMLLGGLWHGASWTFVVWGGLHGTYQCVGHWRNGRRAAQEEAGTLAPSVIPEALRPVLAWLATFNLVCFAWIFFRAESFATAFDVIKGIFDVTDLLPGPTLLLVAVVVGMLAAQFSPRWVGAWSKSGFSRLAPVLQGVALALSFVLIDTLGPVGVAPFIYFQF